MYMKLLKLGVALVLIVFVAIIALASFGYIVSNDFSEDDVSTFNEEVCVNNPDDVTCIENTYVKCNGKTYEVPVMTGQTVREKVFIPEYIKIGCTEPIIITEEKKLTGEELPSPADRIEESDVIVHTSNVVIDISNARLREFIDSNSMDPLIDRGTTTIEIKPKKASEIKVGDIISYNVEDYDYAFVHRVVEIGEDNEGDYFITQGDNYWIEDPDKVRFSQIEGIVVGILY